jgi:hypothetical protein
MKCFYEIEVVWCKSDGFGYQLRGGLVQYGFLDAYSAYLAGKRALGVQP